MFYQNGAWWFHDEEKVTELPLQTATYQTTTEKKLILGYESTKVIMTTAYDVIDVWIATGLPSSLMPIAGFRPMDGAILELTSTKTYIKFVAQEVIAQN